MLPQLLLFVLSLPVTVSGMSVMNESRIQAGGCGKEQNGERLQQSVQQESGMSYEVIMGPSQMAISSAIMSGGKRCSMRIDEYYTRVYETPVQYNITNLAEETFMANIDTYGQTLGGSGYPGQTLFPQFPSYNPPSNPPVNPHYAASPFARMECFSADSIVETSEGPKRMSELKTGNEVLSIDEMMIVYSPIIMFLHRDEELRAEFNVITTESGESLKLTNEHLIYVNDCELTTGFQLLKAKDVTTEHCLIVSRSPVRMLTIDRVTNITKTYERGIYAPLTMTGDIIVNDIVASCHSNLAVHTLQDTFFSVYQSISSILPEKCTIDLPLGLTFFTSAIDIFIPDKVPLD